MVVKHLLPFVTAALLTAGCAEESPVGTAGEYSNLRFTYATEGACNGCSLEREVLVGSAIDIEVRGVSTKVRYEVRSTAPDVADFAITQRCTYLQDVNCNGKALATTKKPGDATLEVFDDWTGTVMDRVTVHVREAAALESTVKVGTSKLALSSNGVYEVPLNAELVIDSKALSASGAQLIATDEALKSVFSQQGIIERLEEDRAVAVTPGSTMLLVTTAKLKNELRFLVR